MTDDRKPMADELHPPILATLAVSNLYPGCPVRLVGSTFIKGEGNDIDILVQVKDLDKAESVAIQAGYRKDGGSCCEFETWSSLKLGKVNLLLCHDPEYYDRWVMAAEACQFLHKRGVTLSTGDVHGVHAIIMDGTEVDAEVDNRKGY